MRPLAIIAVDTNPDYLTCLPLVCRSWELQGFYTYVSIILPNAGGKKLANTVTKFLPKTTHFTWIGHPNIPSVNKAIFIQCRRLYMPLRTEFDWLTDDTYCILSDVDMFIGSSFLYRDFDKVNSFGHDLTGFGEIPMCYVGMTSRKWKEVMGNTTMQEDLDKYGSQHDPDWYKAWGSDQQILTAKLKEYGFHKVNFINRGSDYRNVGLPMGRWDRYNWVKPGVEIHDVHMLRDPLKEENYPKIKYMLETVYPVENWSWVDKYREEILNLNKK